MTATLDSGMIASLERLSPEQLAQVMPLVRQAMRDKTYQLTPLGEEVARYLRSKRKRLTATSLRSYEGTLAKLAQDFPDLRLSDFELPMGAERVEEFLDGRWGDAAPGTYNVCHAHVSDFFDWQVKKGRLYGNPCTLVERARKRDVYRTTFSPDQCRAIIAAAEELRDRIALRLLLDYALRKGALRRIQFKHFDHRRKRLTIFTKSQKVRELPLPQPKFWHDLERHILDAEALPSHYLMCVIKPVPVGPPDAAGRRRTEPRRFPERPMSPTAAHRWWYRRLEDAGIVPVGETSGERMHKARHTAGQRMLDATGNLKAVQALLGHATIQTTADVYTDWDVERLAQSLMQSFRSSEDESA